MDERPDQVSRSGMPEEGVREKLSRERDEINPNPSDTDDELESLRLELARTRSQMSETVYAIQGRMDPRYVREQTSSQAKDTAKEAGSSLMDTIKNNPVPAALTGAGVVGLGWLIASGSGDSGSGGSRGSSGGSKQRGVDDGPYYYGSSERSYPAYYGESEYGDSSEGSGRERAQEAAGQARERAGQVGGQIQDRAGQAGEQAQQQAQRAKGGFQKMLQESPLALGALAAGVGAAVALTVPGTSKENEAMGETRDHLVERGKQSARETRERAQKVLEEGRRSAEQEAQRQDLAPE